MKRKKGIIIILIIILIAIIAIVSAIVYFNRDKENIIVEEFDTIYEDGVKINTSKELAKERDWGNLHISNIILSCRNGLSTLLADVTNNGTTITENQVIKIELIDKEQNVIMELECNILPIKPGEMKQLNANVGHDVAGAYDFRISEL